jgi:hypothetical protein
MIGAEQRLEEGRCMKGLTTVPPTTTKSNVSAILTVLSRSKLHNCEVWIQSYRHRHLLYHHTSTSANAIQLHNHHQQVDARR